jgi:hypothetical protein
VEPLDLIGGLPQSIPTISNQSNKVNKVLSTQLHTSLLATKMITGNNTAEGIIKGTIKQKRSKSIDMRFYWLKDRQEQGQFDICWEPGKTNLADYTTKHHPSSHHKRVRPIYLYMKDESPHTLQGCIGVGVGVEDQDPTPRLALREPIAAFS